MRGSLGAFGLVAARNIRLRLIQNLIVPSQPVGSNIREHVKSQ
jgi:hypothetical protein